MTAFDKLKARLSMGGSKGKISFGSGGERYHIVLEIRGKKKDEIVHFATTVSKERLSQDEIEYVSRKLLQYQESESSGGFRYKSARVVKNYDRVMGSKA